VRRCGPSSNNQYESNHFTKISIASDKFNGPQFSTSGVVSSAITFIYADGVQPLARLWAGKQNSRRSAINKAKRLLSRPRSPFSVLMGAVARLRQLSRFGGMKQKRRCSNDGDLKSEISN
jgi:hypothetical protein